MTASPTKSGFRPIYWREGKVHLIDQTRLPQEEIWLELSSYQNVIAAIKEMRIRGAPAIGIAGGYAVALAAVQFSNLGEADFKDKLESASQEIKNARPTGANLVWAVDRVLNLIKDSDSAKDVSEKVLREAIAIQEEDEAANRAMGAYGASLFQQGSAVLTHCNTGALATGGYGTALGVIQTAWDEGRISHVYATETRPFLQGARLTAWELVRANIDATLIPDSSAGQLMRRGEVGAVIVGADRITANGDVANKIGTYTLAVLAKEHRIPFYVAAPISTIDVSLESGNDIPIEERSPNEVTHIGGVRIAPEGIGVQNAAFDVTPNSYISAIVTEKGVVKAPYISNLTTIMRGEPNA